MVRAGCLVPLLLPARWTFVFLAWPTRCTIARSRTSQFLGAAAMIGCLVRALVVTLRAKEESWVTGQL